MFINCFLEFNDYYKEFSIMYIFSPSYFYVIYIEVFQKIFLVESKLKYFPVGQSIEWVIKKLDQGNMIE